MLELLMTRQDAVDRQVLENCQGLEFIVLDELHTYRGRQGADVAMLMRRLRARVGSPENPPICIGTSATMASGGDSSANNAAVASVSSQIFGTDIGQHCVVTETLERVTNPGKFGATLGNALRGKVVEAAEREYGRRLVKEDFWDDPLAIWVETRIGLKNVEKKAERGPPISDRGSGPTTIRGLWPPGSAVLKSTAACFDCLCHSSDRVRTHRR